MGNSRPTINDIAHAAGVSVATVSRALRELPNVAPATRLRVVQTAARLQYEVNPQASRLASGRAWTIGVVAPFFGTWFPFRALDGISSVIADAGYDLLISVLAVPEDRLRFGETAKSLCRRVDGIVLIDTSLGAQQRSVRSLLDRPVVAMGEHLDGATSICIDHRRAACSAVEHLISLGHRRIGLIAGTEGDQPPSPVARQRRVGYEDALAEAEILARPDLVVTEEWSAVGGAGAMSRLLAGSLPPTAVFCMSDEMAFGALQAARSAGVCVPDELSVIGFDDHELSEAFGLTTMRQAVNEMGVQAAETLLALIEGSESTSVITWQVPLVVRGTTAPPRLRVDG